MHPYAKNWRAKGEQPVPDKCHVPVHMRPVLLRLDSTGEITSDKRHFDCNSKKASKCDSKMGKFMDFFNLQKGPCLARNCFVDPNVTLNDFKCSSQVIDAQSLSGNINMPTPPKPSYWGYPRKCKNEKRPLSFDFEGCKRFHPAMIGSRYYGKHLGGEEKPQSEILKGLKICDNSPTPNMDSPRGKRKNYLRPRREKNTAWSFNKKQERANIDSNWRIRSPDTKSSVESRVPFDSKLELKCEQETKSDHYPEGSNENMDIDFKKQKSVSDVCTKAKNCDNLEHKHSICLSSKVQETVATGTDAANADTSYPKNFEKKARPEENNSKPQGETKRAEHSQKTQSASNANPGDTQSVDKNESYIDWFECSGNLSTDCNTHFVTKLQPETNEDEEKGATNNKRKTLQREWSICSDLFPQEIKFTACFQDMSTEKSEVQIDSLKCDKDKCSQSDNDNKLPIAENSDQHSKDNKKIEEKPDRKDHSFILFVRGGNKKCRPSAKKRQRSKLRKDIDVTPTMIQKKNTDRHKSDSQSANKEECNDSPKTNSVHFILNSIDVDSAPSSPSQRQFMFTFNDSDIDLDVFSDSDESFDEEDNSMCSAFSNPLDINVICSFGKKDLDVQTNDKTPKSDIEAYNIAWRIIQVSSSPPVSDTHMRNKSGKKVHFAEDDKLCSVHPMIAWRYAYAAARKGPWEAYGRDRERFQRRIKEYEDIIGPVFSKQRRDEVLADRQI